MPTTFTRAYVLGARTDFTLASNIASLANNAAKPLGKVNNTTLDAHEINLELEITLASAGVSTTGFVEVWLIESQADGGTSDYTDGINPDGTADIASSLKNARCVLTLIANASGTVVRYKSRLPVGQLAPYFTLVIVNKSGAAMAASGHVAKYTFTQDTFTG
jgi:hypothetical protein